MLELYHYEPYANSMKCMVCLKEKGIDFVSRYVDILKFEQHEPSFVALNPNGQVPILVHDGKVIVESTVINEYLEDVFPQVRLRPTDAYERHRMRVISKWNDEILMPSVSMLGWHSRFHPFAKNIDEKEFQQRMRRVPLYEIREKWETTRKGAFTEAQLNESRRKIRWMIARMEEALSDSKWLAGPEYSLADINTYPQIEGVTRLYKEFWNEKNAARSIEWLARMNERPAVKAAFALSRFSNAPGQARDADKTARATA
ncbi:MAG: glutathione S-transferase family protein [Bradyrhizobiaceae bacterium]|nr:glutathione S-transferase family protein [Bradyrhizobiaceae bacterium]